MKKYSTIIILLIILVLKTNAQGLIFQNPLSIEDRTSYDVFHNNTPLFHQKLSISFDMKLPYEPSVGYIIRINGQTSNLAYNMFYDGRGNDFFELNEEGRKPLLKYKFKKSHLLDKVWFHMQLIFDSKNKTITLIVDGNKLKTIQNNIPESISPKITFGRSDYLVDLPAFGIKNLVIKDNSKAYSFLLNQTHGTDVYTADGYKIGNIVNPYWGINDAYHWKNIVNLHSTNNAGTCYNAKRHELYFFNRKSLVIYNTALHKKSTKHFVNQCPLKIWLGMTFLDTNNNKLYAYETYREDKKEKDCSIASLNLNTNKWTSESNAQINEGPMHHHGAFFDSRQNRYTIYGGFAAMKYSSTYYTYIIKEHRWQMDHNIIGERFPRYYISMGFDNNRYVYMFGGMGNESGDQTVGRKYFYDLHRIDCKTQKVKKLWEVKWKDGRNVVPVRGMVIMGTKYFYTLCYSESQSDSSLKLYRFSIKDGSYEQLGDSITIHSDRIETNANIYYDKQFKMFIVTVQEFTKGTASIVRAYSINMPVLSAKQYAKISSTPHNNLILFGLIIVFFFFIFVSVYIYKKRQWKQERIIKEKISFRIPEMRANAIYFFGEFTVRDRNNKDITYMFTDKLKQVLCLIIYYSKNGGLSSRFLGEKMWGDKTADKIKNSRSVAINHLRKVLCELDGVEIVYDKNCFKLIFKEPFYCDYIHLLQILDMNDTKDRSIMILRILKRGIFLKMLSVQTLDDFKADTESLLLPDLSAIMERAYNCGNYQLALEYTEIIFNIDPFNDKAYNYNITILQKMNRIKESQKAIHSFNENYYKTFGENYSPKES